MTRIKVDNKIFVGPREYAEINNLCIKTVYNRVKEGKIETKHVLGRLLIRLS